MKHQPIIPEEVWIVLWIMLVVSALTIGLAAAKSAALIFIEVGRLEA
jgi:hypothetical protein